MKFIEAEDDNKNHLYQRMVSDDGKIEIGIYPVMFGYRVRAGYVGDVIVMLDWCGGDEQANVEILYSIMKNLLENRESFSGIPERSQIKPFYNDENFTKEISSMVFKPLKIHYLKPLFLDRKKLMASI